MELMRSQKNELLEIIKTFELESFNFKWSMDKDIFERQIQTLRYKDTSYYFAINISRDTFTCLCSPGEEKIHESTVQYKWENARYDFRQWLYYLEREISQPDLWEELEKIKVFDDIEFESESENTMQQFTYQETMQIENGINEVRKYLIEVVENDKEQSKIINEKLDYLIHASKRMGRMDWKNVFVGAFVNIATSIGLNQEQGQVIITLFLNTVSGIMKFISTHGQ